MAEQPTIAVTGTGLASGSPDQCTLHISLNHFAETAADALTVTAELATKAIAALADTAIEQCVVHTMGLSIQDFFDQSEQRVTAHIGSYQLDVIIRPIDEVGGVLASLSSTVGDALQIRGINLTIEDSEPLRSQARRLAIQDAKRRAAEISNEVGVRLGPILSIQDESAGPNNFVQRARLTSGHVAAAANVPIEAGNVSAFSGITLIYAIEV
jgi:uncharacterized protein